MAKTAARRRAGHRGEDERKREAGYGGEFFLMLAGALFLAFIFGC